MKRRRRYWRKRRGLIGQCRRVRERRVRRRVGRRVRMRAV